MAPHITKSIILTIICVIIMKLQILTQGQQQVPCLFFMGDSQIDNGNNNFLLTTSKANYFPYGIDYANGPTGIFSNGNNIPSFLAEFLGFDIPIPSFANARGTENLRGVNYGSGAAGILEDSGRHLGDRISMNRQLLNHRFTIFNINLLLGNSTQSAEHLNKCLYIIDIGSNDYINNYFLPKLYLTSTVYSTPDKFADFLIQQYSQQLTTLYNNGARKVVVFGLGLLGCTPHMLSLYPPINGSSSCVNSINNAAQLFNNRLKSQIDNLNSELPNAQFIMINTTNIAQGDPAALGIKVTNAPCCNVTPSTGLCELGGQAPCSNRSEYAFWDDSSNGNCESCDGYKSI